MRVAANSTEGKPHPASSVLKLKGSVLQQEVTELLLEIVRDTGLGVLLVTHDLTLAERISNRVLRLRPGRDAA